MNRPSHRRSDRNRKARISRVNEKHARLRDRVKRSTAHFWQHREARLTWWQRAFGAPMVGGRWLFSNAITLYSALGALLHSMSALYGRRSRFGNRSVRISRTCYRRRLLMGESMEQRQLLASDVMLDVSYDLNLAESSLTARLAAGDLTVQDTSGADSQLIVRVSGKNLVITEENGRPSDQRLPAVSIPLSSVTGKILVATLGGDDKLTVDFTGGNPVPAGGIDFDGGDDDDLLEILGGNFATITKTFTNVNSGSVDLDGSLVTYTGLEPVLLNVGTAADMIFNLPAGGSAATLADAGAVLKLSGATFEETTFANPTNSVTINRGDASDTLMIGTSISNLTTSLTVGSQSDPLSTVRVTGAISLASGFDVSLFAGTISTTASITTLGGEITMKATDGVTLIAPLFSGGGAQTLEGDVDGDGDGTINLDLAPAELIDPNPTPGNQFGATVVVLTTGNVVVTSPYDDYAAADAGAVYLFNGLTGELISTLRGSSANNNIGSNGVALLTNGNFVVQSWVWDNGSATDAGAVTWGSGTSGVSGTVSPDNSLVGSTAGDSVGGVTALTNGNYVVTSAYWDNGSVANAGAVTWGSGTSGVSGLVSPANSLVGSTLGDRVGLDGVIELASGNYVVRSQYWDNGSATEAGAVTWGSGASGVSGRVSRANSLVGSTAGDRVGFDSVIELDSGNYVVRSQYWDNGAATDAGAVTWGSGTSGVSGTVSPDNSLVGSTAGDRVGSNGVTLLTNGNYVVISRNWDNETATDAGAVTWGSGTSGISGTVSPANSLVGSTPNDAASVDVTLLTNGNYVVTSRNWDNGAAIGAGAVTWGSGTLGVSGVISPANSLVGSTTFDKVGNYGVIELASGDYVVVSPDWRNGAATEAGAVTWGSGTSGVSGVISPANSLVGSAAGDRVGDDGVIALASGNYVVVSPDWRNGSATEAGAITWGSGTSGVSGTVSPANSLVGSTEGDRVGYYNVIELANGNYVVKSANWHNGSAANAGAVTWGSGTSGVSGVVSAANSLVGSTAGDQVGYSVTLLTNGNFVVGSPFWDNESAIEVGAATWGSGASGVIGTVSPANSLVGSIEGDRVGSIDDVIELANGNYVVRSSFWDNGPATDAGAVTWGSGTSGVSGIVGPTNSLVGSTASDRVGSNGVTKLANGNYVVRSEYWDNGSAFDAGAATWGSGTSGVSGAVGPANSLVGSTADNRVGTDVTLLTNGNYLVNSRFWDNGSAGNAGAVTWGNGTSGVSGTVSPANSLVGSSHYDWVGWDSVVVLASGNYLVRSRFWDNGSATDAGAVTWGSGTSGVSGVVSPANSLVGSTAGDNVGYNGVITLASGNYLVISPNWDAGSTTNAGAITWGSGASGITGPVGPANSLVGSVAAIGTSLFVVTDNVYGNFLVGSSDDGSGWVRIGSQATGFDLSSGSLDADSGSVVLTGAGANIEGTIDTSSSVSLAPTQLGQTIDLGTNTAGSLGLTDAELDQITAETLNIGNATSGAITLSAAITRTTATDVELHSGGDIVMNHSIDTLGGTLLLAPGNSPAGVLPTAAGTDASASTVNVTNDLVIAINSTTVDSGYDQLNVAGAVDLSGANLVFAGSYAPVSGEVFTIVSASGGLGGTTFVGLPDGATITNFLSSGLEATINYTATGAVLTVNNSPLAKNDSIHASANAATWFNVFADNGSGMDTDADLDPLTVTHVNGNPIGNGSLAYLANGLVIYLGSGTFIYVPEANFGGPAMFAYTLSDGNGGTDTARVTIRLISVAAPSWIGDETFRLNENSLGYSPVGRAAGRGLLAPLTYSQSGADASQFDIDESTGAISLKTGVVSGQLNYELKPNYVYAVTLTDVLPATDSGEVTVNLNELLEALPRNNRGLLSEQPFPRLRERLS